MRASDYPRNPRLTRLLESKKGSRVINFAVIPILLIASLLLPPISAASRIADLGTTRVPREGGALTDTDGTQVTFPAAGIATPFSGALTSIPRMEFLAGAAGSDLRQAAEVIPDELLVAKSPFYQLKLRGDAPTQATWVIPIPNDSEPYETLDLYAWDEASAAWQWLPHTVIRDDDQIESRLNSVASSAMVFQTNPQPAMVSADLALASQLPDEGRGALAEVHPTGLFLGGNGALDGAVDATFDQLGSAFAVIPVVRNYDGPIVRTDLLANMLVDATQRQNHVDALVTLAVSSLYNGIDIDYRGLDKNLRGEFHQFLKELADKLHAQGKTLSVRVEPAAQVAEDRWETGAYDWQAIGLIADTVKIPAPVDPRAYVSGGQMDALASYATGQINRFKVRFVLGGRSIEEAGAYLIQKSYADALDPLIGRVAADQTVVEPGQPLNLALVSSRPTSGLVYDPNIGTYVYRYQDDQGLARTVWLENAASLAHKLDILRRYNLQGFTVENLPADGADADLWSLIKNYQQGRIESIQSDLSVEWTVKGSDGQTFSQVRPLSDPGVALAAPNVPGALQVEAAIKDRGQVVARQSGANLAVATYTPVPTPTPLFTPTPTPSPTPQTAELTARTNANVRTGPSTAYPRIGSLRAGATYRVTGRDGDGAWWQISFDGRAGWVSGEVATVSGNTSSVAVVEVAPAPTAAPVAAAPAAAAPPAAPAGSGVGFGYGVQAHMIHNDQAGKSYQMTKAMGFNWVKQQIEWKVFESSPGQIGWGEMDRLVSEANAAGINLLFSVVNAPNWAREGGFDASVGGPPADPNSFASFLGAIAGKYCGSSLKALEVWNEQNLHYEWGNKPIDPAAYMALLRPSYNAIKGACRSMTVVSGALTPTGAPAPMAMDDFAYLEGMYQNGLRQYSDAIGAHPSGFNVPPDIRHENACATIQRTGNSFNGPCDVVHHSWSFRSTMEGYRNIMVKYGDSGKRIWPTEFGWAAGGAFDARYAYANDNDMQEQAEWTVRAYQMMRSWGFVGPAFLWNLNFRVVANGTEKAQWGIVDAGWGPLPIYSALQRMPK